MSLSFPSSMGPLDSGLNRVGLNKPGAKFHGLRLAELAVIYWLPLLILSAKAGLMLGDTVHYRFFMTLSCISVCCSGPGDC
jgi:hypothetical protein